MMEKSLRVQKVRKIQIKTFHLVKQFKIIQQIAKKTKSIKTHAQDKTGTHTGAFELCGGPARVSRMLVTRRHNTHWPNFDLVVGVDLLQPYEANCVWAYVYNCKPACGIISTPCTGLKKASQALVGN